MESLLALKWLNTILVPDATFQSQLTGGWHLIAPPGVKTPYGIVREHVAGEDFTGLDDGTSLIWVPVTMQVNLYERDELGGKGDYSRIGPLADHVYALLQAKYATRVDGIIYHCRRVKQSVSFETVGDVVERYINQHFEIAAQSA